MIETIKKQAAQDYYMMERFQETTGKESEGAIFYRTRWAAAMDILRKFNADVEYDEIIKYL